MKLPEDIVYGTSGLKIMKVQKHTKVPVFCIGVYYQLENGWVSEEGHPYKNEHVIEWREFKQF